ncbi:MAG: hypothetical protein COB15_00160 [Flavobacteriales bacterium]|nr:MAG: hypothetical protein COB15_00160 [Flavobacteriales bacterium]
MAIKSNSLPDELDNPFYIANKNFCEEFEKYVLERNGQVKGKFNVWAYYVSGKINVPKEWVLSYKKSNNTSLGSTPILQSEKEYKEYVLSLIAKWETKLEGYGSLKIRRKTIWDVFLLLSIKNANLYSENRKYIVFSNQENQDLLQKLTTTLRPFFDSGEMFQVILKKNILSIQISTDRHHFNIFEKLGKELN